MLLGTHAPGYQQTGGHIIKMIFSGLHSSIIVPYVVAASPPIPFSNTLVSLTFKYGKVQDYCGQSFVRIIYLLMFWLPNQGLHSLRVCHCSRLKVWYDHIAFSCRLEISPKLLETAGGHLQTFQCPCFLFVCNLLKLAVAIQQEKFV